MTKKTKMHSRNEILFGEVFPQFLQKTRELYLEHSLFVQMDSIKIQDGYMDIPISKVENGVFERSQTLVSHISNATFSTTAVQCSQTETEQFYAPYCDDDIIQHAAIKRIADILKLPEDNITLFEIDDEQRVLCVERGEDVFSSYEELTLVIQELIMFYLDLRKEIVFIDRIYYPAEIFGPFKIIVERERNSVSVRMYSQFGTLCAKLEHIRISDGSNSHEIERETDEPGNDSPTIKCMVKIGIDCTNVDKQETFTSMGLDSLKTAELEMALQAEYPNYPIPTATLLSYPTVEKMDSYLFSCAHNHELKKNKDVDAYCVALTPQQRQIVFMHELEPESRAQFNEPVVFSVNVKAFDQQKFETVLNCIVMRHTILRTIYVTQCQAIVSGTESFLSSKAFCSDPRNFITSAIDISCTSSHFAVHISAGRVTVCLVFHHVAIDGQSISIIMDEIEALYSGRTLSHPAAQYKDYANKTSTVDFSEKLHKWKQNFGCGEFQLLVTDRPRSPAQTFTGSSIIKVVPHHLRNYLQMLRKLGNCTEFCILVAVYKLLVFKTTGISDLAIGFPSSLREGEFLNAVGCFVNIIPLLTVVDSSLTVGEYLDTISAAISKAKNIGVPFELIVSELKLERNDGVAPLFQVLLVMDNVRAPSEKSGITLHDLPTYFTKYEQIWYFQKEADSLSLKVEYNCSLFFEETVVDLVQRFFYLIKYLGESSLQLPLKEVTLATKADFYSIVRRKRANKGDFPLLSIPQMLEYHLPTEGVLRHGDKQLSYLQLNEESDHMARLLSNSYCAHYGELPSRDRCGAVFMERSLEMLQAVFAVWKCGLQVVPFSLDWPTQRALETLKMFENPLLVNTYSMELSKRVEDALCPVIRNIKCCCPCRKPLNLIDPFDLAYITCTSGTTGKPKHVCTEFSGHGNLALAYTKNFHLGNKSCTYQVVNYGFDIFFADLSKTFANGASMVLAKELIPRIEEMGTVTNAYIMPAFLSSLELSDIQQLGFLETLHFGGEAIQAKTLKDLLKTDTCLYQEFGVTEQTVYTAANRMKVDTPVSEAGAPYNNLWMLVRDKDEQLLPEQYQGIFYANGLSLTRGYYKMPVRNSEIIQYRNFGKEIKTGDIMRYHLRRLHLAGRADHQVKIRGRIVDLIEVRDRVASKEGVSACIITLDEDAEVKNLVAYVIPKNEALSAADISDSLALCLPAFCLPRHYVFLEEFPTNVNGKVDKARLPKPQRQTSSIELRAAEGAVEQSIVESFAKYVKRSFMANESFFDHGGDSLKAMLVVQDLSRKGLHIDLKRFFSLRTAEKIAFIIQQQCSCPELVEISPKTSRITKYVTHLSAEQKRIWFLAKLYPNRDSYIIRLVVEMRGNLVMERFNRAFHTVIMVNAASRSFIAYDDMEPVFIRQSGTECFHKLTNMDIGDPLIKGQSLLVAAVQETADAHTLELRIHHIISDGRSLAVFGEELATVYNGKHLELKKDFCENSEQFESLEFWQEYLVDFEPCSIPQNAEVGAVNGEAGYVDVDLNFVGKLDVDDFCNTYHCTLYHVLIMAYIQTLRMTYDIDDVVVGTTMANRTPHNMNIVGLFANTVPLRFSKEFPQIAQQLSYTKEQILSATERQNTPLAEIIKKVVDGRDISKTPLFQNVVTYENASLNELPKMEGLSTKCSTAHTFFTQFVQSWIFRPGKSFLLSIQYDKSQCSSEHVTALANLFRSTLKTYLMYRSLYSGSEQMRGLFDTDICRDTPRNKSLGRIFVKQSLMTPTLFCLESNQHCSYAEFYEMAADIAMKVQSYVLSSYGTALVEDDIICIVLNESQDNYIVIGAVLLMGCAYLCVSPETPSERMRFITENCHPKVIITNQKICSSSVAVLDVNKLTKLNSQRKSRFSFLLRGSPDSLAYIIYTSGTTGTPKGVCVGHQSTINMLEHATRKYAFRPGAKVLQFTKTSFDASVSNTFGALLNGGVLSIRDEEADVVQDLESRQPIAVLHMTPIVMSMFDEEDLTRLEDVERWSFGGETISDHTLNLMLGRGNRLTQLYGPTEVTCYQTLLEMKAGHKPSCIGHAISKLVFGFCSFKGILLRRNRRGQFFCSGENLARGYIGKSRGNFLNSPFRTYKDRVLERNSTVYLTGDKVFCDEANYLNFLGREDDQVKVKSHRIHLSEIESLAMKQNGVENCVCVIQQDKGAVKHIVMYYTGDEVEKEKFEGTLAGNLPRYMMPSVILHLKAFPLTRNGKINRTELSKRCVITDHDVPREPRNHMEKAVLKCFSRVLKRSDVDVDSDFFQFGGHSLLTVRLVDELEKTTNTDVSILDVFQFSNVRDLAKHLAARASSLNKERNEPLRPEERPTPLQVTLLRSFRNIRTKSLYDIPLRIALKKEIDTLILRRVMYSLIMAHPSLRTRFAKSGKKFVLTVLSGTECYQCLLQEEISFVDPFEHPPFVVSIANDYLTIKLNHIVTDGHSMQLIVESIEGLLKGRQARLDHGLLLHSWILKQYEKYREENKEFWRKTLQNFVYNQLPTVNARVVDSSSSKAAVFEFRSPKLWSTVDCWTRIHKSTPFAALLALLSKVFQFLSYDPLYPVPIGFPVNLRNEKMNSAVGYGISSVVVAQDSNTSLAETLRCTMKKVAEAISHALFPYDEMIDLSPSRKLFGIMLVFDTYSKYESEIFKLEPTPADNAKFELSVFASLADDCIKIEYNVDLFDEIFLNNFAESFNHTIADWTYLPSTRKPKSFKNGGCIYDIYDIEKILQPLKIPAISVTTSESGELHLFCKTDDAEQHSIRKILQNLPQALRPKKITVERDRKFEYPLSKQQMQMYYLSLQSVDAYVLPFLKKFPKAFEAKHLHYALLSAIQCHEMLRAIFFERHGEPRQTLLSATEAYVPLVVEFTVNLQNSILDSLNCPLPLLNSPLVRAILFETSNCFVALLKLHHIISDAWSTTILERRIDETLATLNRGEGLTVCRQSFNYMDYSNVNENEISLDERYIDELVSAQQLNVSIFKGKVDNSWFEVSQDVVKFWSQRRRVSIFVGMLGLLSECIMEQFELSSLNIGCPHANRCPKTKFLVGYFLNNVVFHLNKSKSGVGSVTSLHRHVNDVLKRNIPFTDLASYVYKRKGVVHPLFQVYFNCRYDLEYNIDDNDQLLALLPIRAEFPLEVDLDKRLNHYRITFRFQDCIPSIIGKKLVDRFRRKMFGESTVRSEFFPPKKISHRNAEPSPVLDVARDVLGNDSLTPDDNFFTAGGNSLQAIEFAERLEEELITEVDMSCIYEAKSFSELEIRLKSGCTVTKLGLQNTITCASEMLLHSSGSPSNLSVKAIRESPKQSLISSENYEIPSLNLNALVTKFVMHHKSNIAFLEPNGTSMDYEKLMLKIRSRTFFIRNKFAQKNGITISSDTIMPVVSSRSVSTFITCLSVIVAGAAYLPVDLGIPIARIKTLLQESQAICYIGPAIPDVDLANILLQEEREYRGQAYSCNELCDLTYVIHTSGTTGTPKGTCIKHHAVANMMFSATKNFQMRSNDVTYQFTNFIYDNSVLEIFMTLSNGGRLVVDTSIFSPARFVASIEKFCISHCLLFPGVVAAFKDENLKKLAQLRYWIVGAEKLPQKLLDRAVEYRINVIQNYGPTETTAYALTKHMRNLDNSRNLGRPIANAEVRVAEDGELLIRGAGTMRGYLNSKAAFRQVGEKRFYESGDYVHVLPNNDIVFIGRKDDQVKIRGHRVELGEIECVISKLLYIKQCKVLWEEDVQSILAFCTLEVGDAVTTQQLLQYSSLHLPKHMLPNEVVFLEEFPLTSNTKIDVGELRNNWRKSKEKTTLSDIAEAVLGRPIDTSLSLLENGGTTWHAIRITSAYMRKFGRSPSVPALLRFPLMAATSSKVNATEEISLANEHNKSDKISQRLRRIWKKLLQHDHFDKNDNFILVGGHSLLLLKLRYELSKEFHTEFAINELLSALNFDKMVGMLCNKEIPSKIVTILSDHSVPLKTLVFIHPIYGGTVPYASLIQSILRYGKYCILCVQHPNSFGYNTEESRFFESIQSLGKSYAKEIDEYIAGHGGVVLVGASFGGTMALEISRHLSIKSDVIALDSGTSYFDTKYTVNEHIKSTNEVLALHDVDEETRFWMRVNSWDLLQMLRDYRPTATTNINNFYVFSVDGTDLGWSRVLHVKSTTTIAGAHATMLSSEYSDDLAKQIVSVITN